MVYETKLLDVAQADDWDGLVSAHPFGRGLVTSCSRRHWELNGWSLHVVGLFADKVLRGGSAMVIKRIPRTPWSLARVEALLMDAGDRSGSAVALLKGLERHARALGAAEIELRVPIPESVPIDGVDYYPELRDAVAGSSYEMGTFRPATYLVSLDADDEALLGGYGSKCRRDVRKGLREGVAVEEMRKTEDIRLFFEARGRMAERKGLDHLSASAFETFLPMFERGYVRLFAAMHAGRTCNMALVDGLGMPRYTLGASMAAAFEKGTPPTGQPLHYEIMRWFRDRGAR
ncbi:MAG TPA: hypothetical protein VLM89_03460, partial [Phycisphaerae bacterium]|nr:hypothetical protein [Phycisphaerae bacterium]